MKAVTGAGSGWPLRAAMAGLVVAAMLVLAITILVVLTLGTRQNALVDATQTMTDSGRIINERAQRLLDPARSTLRQLAWDPMTQADDLATRLERLHVFSSELMANRLLSAIYVGYDNGDFFLVRPLLRDDIRQQFNAPAGASFLVQTVTQQADGSRSGEYRYFDPNFQLLQRQLMPGYEFDPRTRPWFEAVTDSIEPVLSMPYIFFTTQQVGVTLSQRSRAAAAVVGLDVVLDDLQQSLGELRTTPGTRLALITEDQRVLAYPDMSRVLRPGEATYSFVSLEELGEASLTTLVQEVTVDDPAALFRVDGEEWLGKAMRFDIWEAEGMQLLAAVPSRELMAGSERRRLQLIALMGLVVLLLLPLGWWVGGQAGRSLDRLTARARRIGRFDFSQADGNRPSPLREVRELSLAMDQMGSTIDHFLRISETLATETQVERMLQQVLDEVLAATHCQAAAVYLCEEPETELRWTASAGQALPNLPPKLWYPNGESLTALATSWTDRQYRCVPLELRGRDRRLEGLCLLFRSSEIETDDPAFLAFVGRLSGMLAVSLETRRLIESQQALFDAVVRLMADAIDAKSPYTGGHCERVPQLATRFLDRLHQESKGPYADFRVSEDERYAFHLGAWLHDCGKVISPEHIVDKATKLETIYNRIHEIRLRYEILWRDAELAHGQRLLAGEEPQHSAATLATEHSRLQDDFAFIARCNEGGEFLPDEHIERLQQLGATTWLRHFDNRLGLSREELARLERVEPRAPQLPATEHLLADRPEHRIPWDGRRPPVQKNDPANRYGFDMPLPDYKQNLGELHNLSIRRGTLTAEDRFRINDHIVQTYVLLKRLPWPRHLRSVPEIAATHHEKLDGTGYPRRLAETELSPQDRIMALVDVFEALTAADRPYKSAKTLSESLRIMAYMCRDKHLDTTLFRYFLHSRLWQEFAQEYLLPEQIDEVDLPTLEALLTT